MPKHTAWQRSMMHGNQQAVLALHVFHVHKVIPAARVQQGLTQQRCRDLLLEDPILEVPLALRLCLVQKLLEFAHEEQTLQLHHWHTWHVLVDPISMCRSFCCSHRNLSGKVLSINAWSIQMRQDFFDLQRHRFATRKMMSHMPAAHSVVVRDDNLLQVFWGAGAQAWLWSHARDVLRLLFGSILCFLLLLLHHCHQTSNDLKVLVLKFSRRILSKQQDVAGIIQKFLDHSQLLFLQSIHLLR
mmetsp:Transcript_30652/g.63261  ORF Transcript_30652/g.63261 Transcript_30652/m.63261 type:complete len:243 (+) Transcript_30652:3165-3893(+)